MRTDNIKVKLTTPFLSGFPTGKGIVSLTLILSVLII